MTARSAERLLSTSKDIASLAIVGLLAFFGWRAHQLRLALNQARYESLLPRPGLWLPALQVSNEQGNPVVLAKTGEPQVLLYLQSTCEFCGQSIPMLNRLADSLSVSGAVRIPLYGIQLDTLQPLSEYVASHKLRFPVVRFKSLRESRIYAARVTPYIVVVDSLGRISYARSKALLTEAAMDSVLSAARPVSPVRKSATR